MERQEELCVEVNKRAHLFLESGKLTDCKFVVGAKPHQVVVGAHMLVMALASPVFEAMFYGSLAETREYIPIVDAELDIFKAMLRYIYTGIVKLSSCDEAIQLYYVANKYMLHQLMKQCSSYLQSNVNLGNVCQLYEHSQLYQDEALTQKCTYIFTENTKELLQDSSFKDAALGTVEYIFSLNELNIDNEVDLINAAALYLSAHDDKVVENKTSSPGIHTAPPEKVLNVEDNVKGVSEAQNATDGAEQETPGSSLMINDTLKQQIRSVVRHIRLLTLTPQQYADCTARSSLLTPAEDFAVIRNVAATNKSSVAMPSGLSTCIVLRDKAGKARSEATFRHTVRNFSSSVREWSPVFYVRNLPWEIEARSRDVGGTKYMGVGVWCNRGSKSTNWSCAANVELRLICHKPGAENSVEKCQRLFNKKDNGWGFGKFLPWDTVLDPTRGYIQDGAVTLEVHVAAEEPQGPLTLTEPQWLRRLAVAGRLGAPVSVRVLPTQPTKRDLSDQTRQQVLFQADTLQIYACAQVFTPPVPNTYIQKLRPANRSLVQNDTDNEINMTEIVNALNVMKLEKAAIYSEMIKSCKRITGICSSTCVGTTVKCQMIGPKPIE